MLGAIDGFVPLTNSAVPTVACDRLVTVAMEDGDGCCIASPPDTSVSSSTSCVDDKLLKPVPMADQLHSSDIGDTEVSSSCETNAACSSLSVDPLYNQVTQKSQKFAALF